MTVGEACKVLKKAKDIFIAWDGTTFLLDTNSRLVIDAFADYTVDYISSSHTEDDYEIGIVSAPVKSR